MPDNKIKQADFVNKVREKIPELKDFSDAQIMRRIFESRPELRDMIDTPDDAALREQQKLEKRSRSIIDPEGWNPKWAQFGRSVLDVLPGAGAITGGALATPETLGGGTIAGAALGAGAGRGLRDLATQALGLEDTSALQKAKNIGMDTGVTAITPGLMTIGKYPIQSARMAAGDLLSAERSLIPKGIRPFITPPILEKFAEGPAKKIIPPARYPINIAAEEGSQAIKPNSQEMEDLIQNFFGSPRKP